MSFVSIVGNSNYINVMSDGLAIFNNGERIEDWKKFEIFSDRFIAYAGNLQAVMPVVSLAKNNKELDYKDWEELLIGFTQNIPYESKNGKALICIGGKENSKLTFCSFSNKPDQRVNKYTPLNNKEILYMFLSNYDDDGDLEQMLIRYVKRYRSFKSSDILLDLCQ